jgi:peptide-methionine (R)-S-oxide reductase
MKTPNESFTNDPGRRRLLLGALAIAGVGVFGLRRYAAQPVHAAQNEHFEVTHTDAEWRALLSPGQYAVLRQQATEPPYSSALDHEHRSGIFSCAGCDKKLFSSMTKFDSGTGWPSFYEPLPDAVGSTTDSTLGMERTEVHCARCGGHLGHVFDDGPKPTGLRYCMNGVALTFTAKS